MSPKHWQLQAPTVADVAPAPAATRVPNKTRAAQGRRRSHNRRVERLNDTLGGFPVRVRELTTPRRHPSYSSAPDRTELGDSLLKASPKAASEAVSQLLAALYHCIIRYAILNGL